MSTYWDGKKRYATGEPYTSMFRRCKHHRIKSNGFNRIRWQMYIAKHHQQEKQWEKEWEKGNVTLSLSNMVYTGTLTKQS